MSEDRVNLSLSIMGATLSNYRLYDCSEKDRWMSLRAIQAPSI